MNEPLNDKAQNLSNEDVEKLEQAIMVEVAKTDEFLKRYRKESAARFAKFDADLERSLAKVSTDLKAQVAMRRIAEKDELRILESLQGSLPERIMGYFYAMAATWIGAVRHRALKDFEHGIVTPSSYILRFGGFTTKFAFASELGKSVKGALFMCGLLNSRLSMSSVTAINAGLLETQDPRVIASLVNSLATFHREGRRNVLYAINRALRSSSMAAQLLKSTEQYNRLVELLILEQRDWFGSYSTTLHCESAKALGLLKSLDAVEPLIAIVERMKGSLEQFEALGEIGDLRAVEPLKRVAQLSRDEYERELAHKALSKILNPCIE